MLPFLTCDSLLETYMFIFHLWSSIQEHLQTYSLEKFRAAYGNWENYDYIHIHIHIIVQ